MSEKNSNSTLTILILATTFPRWIDDNIPRFILDLSEGIGDDFEVIVLSPHYPGADREDQFDGVQVYRYPYFWPKKHQKLFYDGGVIESIRRNPLLALQIPFALFSLLVHSIVILRKYNVDIINSHWLVPNGFIASILNLVSDWDHVMTLHAGGVLGLQKTPFNSIFATFIYKNSDFIIPVSEHIKDSFLQMVRNSAAPSNAKFYVQPMGTHTDEYKEYSKEEACSELGRSGEVVGLFVGRLAEKKGIEYLIKAVEDHPQPIDGFSLVIAGTGPLEKELEQRINNSSASNQIELTGWVEEEKLKKLYMCADFVVVPSIETDSGDTEGMPTVISEAFAARNPVIASDVGGISDVVEDGVNGYLVNQRDPEELSKMIEKLVDNPEIKDKMSSRAEEASEKLDWSYCCKNYKNIFISVHNRQ